jgi:hypothetical protein
MDFQIIVETLCEIIIFLMTKSIFESTSHTLQLCRRMHALQIVLVCFEKLAM